MWQHTHNDQLGCLLGRGGGSRKGLNSTFPDPHTPNPSPQSLSTLGTKPGEGIRARARAPMDWEANFPSTSLTGRGEGIQTWTPVRKSQAPTIPSKEEPPEGGAALQGT